MLGMLYLRSCSVALSGSQGMGRAEDAGAAKRVEMGERAAVRLVGADFLAAWFRGEDGGVVRAGGRGRKCRE